jgi:hypothetical protein
MGCDIILVLWYRLKRVLGVHVRKSHLVVKDAGKLCVCRVNSAPNVRCQHINVHWVVVSTQEVLVLGPHILVAQVIVFLCANLSELIRLFEILA